MSLITSLRVQHVRTHGDITVAISPKATLITGLNGSGKTSLVEALFIALQGSSFKGGDGEVLKRNESWYRIDVSYADKSRRIVKFDSKKTSGRKQFTVDGKVQYRLPARFKYPVVLFEPDDLRLLTGSPSRRRQFIDRFISQLDPHYDLALRRYDRALKQRNALLKQSRMHSDDIFAWNVSLSEYGALIIAKRQHFLDTLNEELNATYERIAHTGDTVSISYSFLPRHSLQQKLLADLDVNSERDRLLGYTSSGPHRHDVIFTFNDVPALTVVSRGETRSIILALKFLEMNITEALTGKNPIVLLDDVFSELDEERQRYLIQFTTNNQVIITSATHGDVIDTKYITAL